jgi:hypothetical protein
VKQKISANVQHLFGLLAAGGLTNATQVDASTLTLQAPNAFNEIKYTYLAKLIGAKPVTTAGAPVDCFAPDAVFGGGTFDVAYRPSDITAQGQMIKGIGQAEVTASIGSPYTVDNEGNIMWILVSR